MKLGKALGKIVGGVGGFLLGGPAGASIGLGLGSMLDSSSSDASDAATAAANTQAASYQTGLAVNKQMFDKMVEMLSPYTQAGTKGLGGMLDLAGLGTPEASQAAISGIEASPEFQALIGQGENAILSNASATGGLRGGNVQAALGQFRPQLLSQLINQRYSRLGNIAQLGQSSAAMTGTQGLNAGNAAAELLAAQGAATAGGQIAAGNQSGNSFNNLLRIAPALYSSGMFDSLSSGLSSGANSIFDSIFPSLTTL